MAKMNKNGEKKKFSDRFSNLYKNLNNSHKKESKPEYEHGPIMISDMEEQESTPLDGIIVDDLENERSEHYRFEANKHYFVICIYALGTIAAAALIIYLIMNVTSIMGIFSKFLKVISTFIVGFFIAFVLNPLVMWVDKTILVKLLKIKSPKARLSLSILITYLFTLSLIVVGISYIIPQLATSVSDLIKKQDNLYQDALDLLGYIEERFQIDFKYVEEQLQSLWPQLVNYGTNLVMDVFPRLLNLGISIFKVAINVLISIAISIYMLFDKRKLSKMMVRVVYAVLPVKKASSMTTTFKECGTIFSSFVIGKAIDSLIIGIICFIAMRIAGLPYTMLVSVIVGITNMIPYFGPFIGAIPGVLLFLFINPLDAVVFTIMIFIIQQFDGWILGPYILGEATGTSPLWIIFAITVGGAYYGVIGMFLGVPVLAVISYLINRIIDGKLKKKKVAVK